MNNLKNTIGLWRKRVYNSLKHRWTQRFGMPDYPEKQLGIYNIRLRPNDPLRWTFAAKLGLPDFLNYYNVSDINFDLRIGVRNRKDTRNIKDTFKYEWIFCNDDDIPIVRTSDPRFHFYDIEGSGTFELTTAKPPKIKKRKKNNNPSYYRYEDRYQIMVFKSQAVKIGNYSKTGHYKLVMRFTDSSGATTGYVCIAQFTIMDKDRLRQWVLYTILGLFATGIAGLILKGCGITL